MARTPKVTRMGRPPLPADQRKRPSMGFRPTSELREKLESAAAESGLSLTQEVERRLEWSFSDPDARLQGFGSEERLKLLRTLALAVDMVETTTGKDILTDPDTASVAYDAMEGILDGILVARPGAPLDKTSPAEGQEMILKNPNARSRGKNIRDVILEGRLSQLPATNAAFAKGRKR